MTDAARRLSTLAGQLAVPQDASSLLINHTSAGGAEEPQESVALPEKLSEGSTWRVHRYVWLFVSNPSALCCSSTSD